MNKETVLGSSTGHFYITYRNIKCIFIYVTQGEGIMKRTMLKKNAGVVQKTSDIGSIATRIFCYPYIMIVLLVIPDRDLDLYILTLIIAAILALCEFAFISADKNNYIEIGEGKIVMVKKAVKLDRDGHHLGAEQRMEEEFMAENVEEINSTKNLYGRFLWREHGGTAHQEEFSFKLKNGANVIKDFRNVSFGDRQKIFQYIYHRSGTIPE